MEPKTDNLKIVPQVFFDLIARVVPGALAILSWLLLSGTTWSSVVVHAFGGSLNTESFSAVSLLTFAFASYVVGQLMSPVVKCLQRLSEGDYISRFVSKHPLFKKYCDIGYPMPKASHAGYDFLRCHHPAIGEMCQKIRAEFLMYYGFAIVFLVSAIWSLTPFVRPEIRRWDLRLFLFSMFMLGTIIMTIRARSTRDTHEKTIMKFLAVLNISSHDEPQATIAAGHDS